MWAGTLRRIHAGGSVGSLFFFEILSIVPGAPGGDTVSGASSGPLAGLPLGTEPRGDRRQIEYDAVSRAVEG
jgi:hypothetical protein